MDVCCIFYEPFAQLNYILTLNYSCHAYCMSLLAEKESAGSLYKVLSRSVTFEASDVHNRARKNDSNV